MRVPRNPAHLPVRAAHVALSQAELERLERLERALATCRELEAGVDRPLSELLAELLETYRLYERHVAKPTEL